MTKQKEKFDKRKWKRVLPYIVTGVLTLALVFVGSLDKKFGDSSLSLDVFAATGYKVSVDQLSEMYTVADIADAMSFASADDVASNYVIVNTMYKNGQTATYKLEKPNITNLAISRGVVEYIVNDGDTMDSIAAKYGISTDEIRWSNDRKTTEISAGELLYIPSTSGIVYTVKEGETADSIAEKYGSSAAEIIALNDLEVSGIKEGMRIVIKGGTLPETERPEYEPPVQVYTSFAYTYSGYASSRTDLSYLSYDRYSLRTRYPGGWCTTWADTMRPDISGEGEDFHSLGDAKYWASSAQARGFQVDREPSAGAIFQTGYGTWGHVGYVESVNPDGSIVVTEMNYSGGLYSLTRSTIPANYVSTFYYIH